MAQITPGLSGADLASLVNEAAIRAVRRASNEVRPQINQGLALEAVKGCCVGGGVGVAGLRACVCGCGGCR